MSWNIIPINQLKNRNYIKIQLKIFNLKLYILTNLINNYI